MDTETHCRQDVRVSPVQKLSTPNAWIARLLQLPVVAMLVVLQAYTCILPTHPMLRYTPRLKVLLSKSVHMKAERKHGEQMYLPAKVA